MESLSIKQLYKIKTNITNLIENRSERNKKFISKMLIKYLKNQKYKHHLIDNCIDLRYNIRGSGESNYFSLTVKIFLSEEEHKTPLSFNISPESILSKYGYLPFRLFDSDNYFYESPISKTNFDRQVNLLSRKLCLEIIDLKNYILSLDKHLEKMHLHFKELLDDYPLLEVIETLILIKKYRNSILSKLNKDEFKLIVNRLVETYLEDVLSMISLEEFD